MYKKMPKISQILNWATETLQKTNINSANLDAEILLFSILKKDKSFIFTHPELELTKTQTAKHKRFIARRAKGEPVAYILGQKEFFGLDFVVNKNVLIPRPETELMADEVVKLVSKYPVSKCQSFLFIDVGTGSGCIPISVLNELRIMNYELSIKTIATDVSVAALKVAQKNARRHGLTKKIKFIKSNLLEKIHNSLYIIPNSKIVITANLPYLPDKIYKENYTNLKFEPRLALVAKKNGLALYEKLLKQVAGYPPLSKGRRGGVVIGNNNHPLRLLSETPPSKGGDKTQVTILLEILPFQKPTLTKLIKKHLPGADVKFKKDLAGKWRVAVIDVKI